MKSWRIFIWKSELWTKSNRKNLFEQTWKAKPIQQILFGIFFDICIFSFWKFFFSLIPSIFYCMVYAQIIKREKKMLTFLTSPAVSTRTYCEKGPREDICLLYFLWYFISIILQQDNTAELYLCRYQPDKPLSLVSSSRRQMVAAAVAVKTTSISTTFFPSGDDRMSVTRSLFFHSKPSHYHNESWLHIKKHICSCLLPYTSLFLHDYWVRYAVSWMSA